MGYDPVVAQDLAPALGVDADGDDYGDRNAAPGLAHLHVGGVQPKSRPVAFQGVRILSSISMRSHDAWLLKIPVIPIALTGSSTNRSGCL